MWEVTCMVLAAQGVNCNKVVAQFGSQRRHNASGPHCTAHLPPATSLPPPWHLRQALCHSSWGAHGGLVFAAGRDLYQEMPVVALSSSCGCRQSSPRSNRRHARPACRGHSHLSMRALPAVDTPTSPSHTVTVMSEHQQRACAWRGRHGATRSTRLSPTTSWQPYIENQIMQKRQLVVFLKAGLSGFCKTWFSIHEAARQFKQDFRLLHQNRG